jgi:hypothetical protein
VSIEEIANVLSYNTSSFYLAGGSLFFHGNCREVADLVNCNYLHELGEFLLKQLSKTVKYSS